MTRILLVILSVTIAVSCRSGNEKTNEKSLPGRNEIVDMNKYLVQKDRERIESYTDRRGLNMTESSSGLWSKIESEGEGRYFTDNDRIVMEYDCYLIDGTGCYSSEDLGPREVILGRSEMEPGLNQALRMLKPGGKGIFILPPFLAFGLKGDGKKIPPRAVIVYEIHLASLISDPSH